MCDVKVSVVVPVYNIEKYLRRCINSIVSQTYKNLEIILIDDGSKDGSGIICDEYVKKDFRVKVFHIKNSGSAEARNVGLNNAIGKYIMFVDSDDFLEITGIERLVNLAERYKLDILCGKYKIVDINGNDLNLTGSIIFQKENNNNLLNGENYLVENGIETVIWKYFYSLEYLKKINLKIKSFKNNGCYEDNDFVIRAIHGCNRIMNSDIVFYNYVQIPTSQKHRKEAELSFNIIEIAEGLTKYNTENVKSVACKKFFNNYIDFLYAQSVQRIIQLQCDLQIFNDDIFKEKVAKRLLKTQIKKYRIIGFCLKFGLMPFYNVVYYWYREIFWKGQNL